MFIFINVCVVSGFLMAYIEQESWKNKILIELSNFSFTPGGKYAKEIVLHCYQPVFSLQVRRRVLTAATATRMPLNKRFND